MVRGRPVWEPRSSPICEVLPCQPWHLTTYVFYAIVLALLAATVWRDVARVRDSMLAFALSTSVPMAILGSGVSSAGIHSSKNIIHHVVPLASAAILFALWYRKHVCKPAVVSFIFLVFAVYLVQVWRYRIQRPPEKIYAKNPFSSFAILLLVSLTSAIGVLWLIPAGAVAKKRLW